MVGIHINQTTTLALIGLPRLLTHGYFEEKGMNYMVITKFDVDLE